MDLLSIGKKAKIPVWEVPKAILLEPNLFSIEK
jgi:hypothetical protein